MTIYELENKLRQDAKDNGSANGQLWHEADIDGYNMYIADSSFGNGPIFRIGRGINYWGFEKPYDEWVPVIEGTALEDLDWIMPLAEKAIWKSRLNTLQKF